jgi:CDP-diglyceride synthetase
MVASSIGLSLIAIFAVLIASLAGADTSEGAWPTVVLLPLIGFPIGFVLIFALLITNIIKRGRAAKDAGN